MNLSSKLGLGTVQFGIPYGISNLLGQTQPIEVTKILEFARKNGISLLDTAYAYGTSEDVLGKNNLKGFQIVSKFSPPKKGESINNQLYKSLSRLNVNSIYGYLAHSPLNLLENPSQWKELLEFKREGLVKKIGFSLNSPSELETLSQKGLLPDLVQVPFSYLDRRFKPSLINLKKNGCEVHARSIFLQGLILSNTNTLGDFFDEVKPIIISLQDNVNNLSGALLSFVLDQHFIDKVIIGVENTSQLKENLENFKMGTSLPDLLIHINEKILMPSQWPKTN